MQVKDVMTGTPYCCRHTDTVRRAAELLKKHDIGSLPVVDDYTQRKLIGLVTDRDICIQIASAGRNSELFTVNDVMAEFPFSCGPEDDLDLCESIMEKQQVRRVPVVGEEGRCIGIVSQADIALADSHKHTGRLVAAISQPVQVTAAI